MRDLNQSVFSKKGNHIVQYLVISILANSTYYEDDDNNDCVIMMSHLI